MSKKYTQDRLEKALFDVAHGMAYRTAAKKYDVPRTTLKYKFEGKIKKIKDPKQISQLNTKIC